MSKRNFVIKREYNKWPVACSLPPIYKSTFCQYWFASLDTRASVLFGSMYLIEYAFEPANPGIVLQSYGYPSLVAQFFARAIGGSPLSVGKYLSTSGSNNGSSLSGNGVAIPFL